MRSADLLAQQKLSFFLGPFWKSHIQMYQGTLRSCFLTEVFVFLEDFFLLVVIFSLFDLSKKNTTVLVCFSQEY